MWPFKKSKLERMKKVPLTGDEASGTIKAIRQKSDIKRAKIERKKARRAEVAERWSRHEVGSFYRKLRRVKRILGKMRRAVNIAGKDKPRTKLSRVASFFRRFKSSWVGKLESNSVEMSRYAGSMEGLLAQMAEVANNNKDKRELGALKDRIMGSLSQLTSNISAITNKARGITEDTKFDDKVWTELGALITRTSNAVKKLTTDVVGGLAKERQMRDKLGKH